MCCLTLKGNELRDDLEPGDHIYSWRQKACSLYAHHGIYIGNNNVVHFTKSSSRCEGCRCRRGASGVILTCLDCFLEGNCLRRYKYGVSKISLLFQIRGRGSCTVAPSDPPKSVIARAMYLFEHENKFGEYDLFKLNCEDFALYCKTGFITGPLRGASGQVAALRAVGMVCFLQRYEGDIGVRVDKIRPPLGQISEWRSYLELINQ